VAQDRPAVPAHRPSRSTKPQVRRGVHHDVPELIAAIEHFIDGYNDRAQPFVWTKTSDQILAKAVKQQDTSDALHYALGGAASAGAGLGRARHLVLALD